ncbi:hypothetical protein WICPIJ_008395 [Wickerhamomyces pijperi]|uniref:Uncharacterized protein n=1 Tax=Wickerhamomyces pijperi TaxID=599730 RepID=A0A9P8PXN1_WICPI|nr:hypothetical protein WICPIJ_008395 [Wickerhamomyces pijperi]
MASFGMVGPVQSVDGGPLTSTLLTSRVQDLFQQRSTVDVVVVQDVLGDVNQEGVQDTLVPLGKDVTDFLVGEATNSLQDVVSFSDQLHVTVLNTVVNHLDVVTRTGWTNPVTTWLTVRLGSDGLENVLNVWPSFFGTTWH